MSTLHAFACCAALFALPVAVVWPAREVAR